jgi:hypothetical protein
MAPRRTATPPSSGGSSARAGSRRAATDARRDREPHRDTVKDRDRRFRPARAPHLAVLTGCHDPQQWGLPCGTSPCRSRTEEARGSNPLTSTAQRPWSPAWRIASAGPAPPQGPWPGSKRAATAPKRPAAAGSRPRRRLHLRGASSGSACRSGCPVRDACPTPRSAPTGRRCLLCS